MGVSMNKCKLIIETICSTLFLVASILFLIGVLNA
nr:MAG TPA_asm: hypothetical protein [Caudoviricetes sp.]